MSIDFATAQDATGRWSVYALEINLRKGGTTHPYAALRNLVPGRYDLESGRWVCTDGSERAYQATDNVLDDALAGGSARWWSRRCGLTAVSDRRDRGR